MLSITRADMKWNCALAFMTLVESLCEFEEKEVKSDLRGKFNALIAIMRRPEFPHLPWVI